MEQTCDCGRNFVHNGSALCPICIAEAMTGKEIGAITPEENKEAINIYHNDHHKTVELLNRIRNRK